MHTLNLPAGAAARFTATARPDRGLHRWAVRVLPASEGPVRLTFGSQIGGRDLDQRVEIPIQAEDCRLEIQSSHETATGWADDRSACLDDAPDRLRIGFCDAARPGAMPDDVLLSFTFGEPQGSAPAAGARTLPPLQ
ncbi:MAG: hypothetical protein ACOY5Y_06370 [Pseudomonadota bacterium]|jgi:hypothetical protein